MTSLNITSANIPPLPRERVIIAGASSGIGLAAATIFAQKGASVVNLDVNRPSSIAAATSPAGPT